MQSSDDSKESLQNFLITPNLGVAWNCYLEWCEFQEQLGLKNQVGFAGCFVNSKNCWKVMVTQSIYDQRVQLAPAAQQQALLIQALAYDDYTWDVHQEQSRSHLVTMGTAMFLVGLLL